MSDSPLLTLSNVSKKYGDLQVLYGVNLSLQQGEAVAIVGPSGCGKSTLLNLIGTLDTPDGGTVTLNGRDVTQLTEEERAKVRNTEIGFVFQMHHLLPQCTVLENVLVPTLLTRPAGAEARARQLLERVGLSERLAHFPGQLSGGERQRVAVVRALIHAPKLLLADEPTGALDQRSAENLADLLIQLNREEGVALVVITHSPTLAARMGTTYTLKEGALV
jgi:ABC-type lipoprotein export system ATPase subunit